MNGDYFEIKSVIWGFDVSRRRMMEQRLFGHRLFGEAKKYKSQIIGRSLGREWLVNCSEEDCKRPISLNRKRDDPSARCIYCAYAVKILNKYPPKEAIHGHVTAQNLVHIRKKSFKATSKYAGTVPYRFCAQPACRRLITVLDFLKSGRKLCSLHVGAEKFGMKFRGKFMLENKDKIVKITVAPNRVKTAWLMCEGENCKQLVAHKLWKLKKRCGFCRAGAKFILGHLVRHPIALEHADKIVRISGKTAQNRVFYVRCDSEQCKGEVSLKAYASRTRIKCVKCEPGLRKMPEFMSAYGVLKKQAHLRGHRFTLTFAQFKFLCSFNECHYCLDAIERATKRHRPGTHGSRLDRVINAYGYFLENLVPCCSSCNARKHSAISYEQAMFLGALTRKDAEQAQAWAKALVDAIR